MPLVFSPLTESVLEVPPKKLLPRRAFVMRQIGSAPAIDLEMYEALKRAFSRRSIGLVDAGASTASKDFLERILELIRSTGLYRCDLLARDKTDRLRQHRDGTRLCCHVRQAGDYRKIEGRRCAVRSHPKQILRLLDMVREKAAIADLERLRMEVKTFIQHATDASSGRLA